MLLAICVILLIFVAIVLARRNRKSPALDASCVRPVLLIREKQETHRSLITQRDPPGAAARGPDYVH